MDDAHHGARLRKSRDSDIDVYLQRADSRAATRRDRRCSSGIIIAREDLMDRPHADPYRLLWLRRRCAVRAPKRARDIDCCHPLGGYFSPGLLLRGQCSCRRQSSDSTKPRDSRQFSSTMTCSSRKTRVPSSDSISLRAEAPIAFSFAPPLPIRIAFCPARSQ